MFDLSFIRILHINVNKRHQDNIIFNDILIINNKIMVDFLFLLSVKKNWVFNKDICDFSLDYTHNWSISPNMWIQFLLLSSFSLPKPIRVMFWELCSITLALELCISCTLPFCLALNKNLNIFSSLVKSFTLLEKKSNSIES